MIHITTWGLLHALAAGDAEPAKKAKAEAGGTSSQSDFSSNAKTKSGKHWNLKIASWNVDGLRGTVKKNGHAYITQEDPDIICLQETKCTDKDVPKEFTSTVEGYHGYWYSPTEKKGYAGTALLSKTKPHKVTYGIGVEEHDDEGRVITAEFDNFYMVTAYVPNAGKKLVRLDYRQTWDEAFTDYLKKLDKKKPVVLCGDLNVAHNEIDLKNPKTNRNKTPGFTDQEREGFTSLLDQGFKDSYRELYPEETDCYTFWTYMGGARAKNVGWRLDYFVLSDRLMPHLCDNVIRSGVMGSDHCPIVLLLAMGK
ncbi:PREDICTED: exodeoxyribonuclease-like isoform X1 [Branchiostoma belcheri]|uniref:exodeoxyribonuclease III n=1 Tax=Branchiostoma belcheri TaxID=7741 RepID=A0A6P5ABG0_BRABE|nr:PREDICTED: exodeoxyribonuclease-like isoform X1 [Branchiostoma belcheri]